MFRYGTLKSFGMFAHNWLKIGRIFIYQRLKCSALLGKNILLDLILGISGVTENTSLQECVHSDSKVSF